MFYNDDEKSLFPCSCAVLLKALTEWRMFYIIKLRFEIAILKNDRDLNSVNFVFSVNTYTIENGK
jgi:hypothetical protein